jgi:hypothetical protein
MWELLDSATSQEYNSLFQVKHQKKENRAIINLKNKNIKRR